MCLNNGIESVSEKVCYSEHGAAGIIAILHVKVLQ